jgi:hypothetical protein
MAAGNKGVSRNDGAGRWTRRFAGFIRITGDQASAAA